MVERSTADRARKPPRRPPLEITCPGQGVWIDETGSSANRGSLVQLDAHGAYVALARPVRVPDVRAAAPGVLGSTFTSRAARTGAAVRNTGPKRLGDGDGIED